MNKKPTGIEGIREITTKSGESTRKYEITVTLGYNKQSNKQNRISRTVTLPKSIKRKYDIEEWLRAQKRNIRNHLKEYLEKIQFENDPKIITVYNLAKQTLDNKRHSLKYKGKDWYDYLLSIIANSEFGNFQVAKVTNKDIIDFIAYLNEKEHTIAKYKPIIDLQVMLIEKNWTIAEAARKSKLSEATIHSVVKGNSVLQNSAEKIASTLNIPFKKAFALANSKKGLSEKTIFEIRKFLVEIFNFAVKLGTIEECPIIPDVKKSKLQKFTVYDEEECKILIDALKDEEICHRTVIIFLLETGLRIGEAVALLHKDIDFTTKMLHIDKTLKRIRHGGVIENTPKTEYSIRDIIISDATIKLLNEYLEWKKNLFSQLGKNIIPDDRFFVNTLGNPWAPDSMGKYFSKFIKKNGLKPLTLHGLRHSFASIAVANGVEIPVLQSVLGHSKPSITANYYLHPLPSGMKKAAKTMNSVYEKLSE